MDTLEVKSNLEHWDEFVKAVKKIKEREEIEDDRNTEVADIVLGEVGRFLEIRRDYPSESADLPREWRLFYDVFSELVLCALNTAARYVIERLNQDWAIRDRWSDGDRSYIHPIQGIETREEAEELRGCLVRGEQIPKWHWPTAQQKQN